MPIAHQLIIKWPHSCSTVNLEVSRTTLVDTYTSIHIHLTPFRLDLGMACLELYLEAYSTCIFRFGDATREVFSLIGHQLCERWSRPLSLKCGNSWSYERQGGARTWLGLQEYDVCGWHRTGLFGEPWGRPMSCCGRLSADMMKMMFKAYYAFSSTSLAHYDISGHTCYVRTCLVSVWSCLVFPFDLQCFEPK